MALRQPTYHPQHPTYHHPSFLSSYPPAVLPHTPELTPPKMELALHKPGGPMGGPMAAPSGGLASYAAQMVVWLWFGTHSPSPTTHAVSPTASSPPTYPLNPLQIHPSQAFARFVSVILQTTLVSHSVTIVALLYIYRLKLKHRNILGQPGSEFRLFVSSLVLSNKFLDDNTYTNRTWAEIAGIDLREVNGMEAEFLEGLNYHLSVDPTEYRHWLSMLDGFVAAREREATAVVQRARAQAGPYHSPVSPLHEARARSASPPVDQRPQSSPAVHRKRSAIDAFAFDVPQQYEVLDHLRYPGRKNGSLDWNQHTQGTIPPPPAGRAIARLPSNGNMDPPRRGSLSGWQGDVTMASDSRPQTAVDGRGYQVLMAPYERPPQHNMVPPEQMLFYTLSARSHPGQDGAPRKGVLHYQDPTHPHPVQHHRPSPHFTKSHRPSLSAEYRNPQQSQPYRGSTLSTSTSPTEMIHAANSNGASPMDFQYAPPYGNGRLQPPVESTHPSYRSVPSTVPMQSQPYLFGSPSTSALPNPFDYSYPPQRGVIPHHYPYAPMEAAQPRPASFANAGLPGYVYGQPIQPQQQQPMVYSAHPSARPFGLGLNHPIPSGTRSEWSSPARERPGPGWY